jgi:Putative Ig domain
VASEDEGGPDPAPGWFAGGGTSYASPQWAALAALIDEGVTGGRLGLLTPMLFQVAATNPSAFTDVTQGNNNYLTVSNSYLPEGTGNYSCTYGGSSHLPCYEAAVGYDMASGLGLPVGSVLAAAVRALAVSPFSVSSTSLLGGVVGVAYSAVLDGNGGVAPYSWSMTQGSLPAGLALDPTGTITGTPTTVGTDSFVVSAADASVGVSRTDSVVLSIAVGPAAAPFYGSGGGSHLNKPIVGMAPSPTGHGYWLVASDGGIFALGDAPFYGSEGGSRLNAPVVGMEVDAGLSGGYRLVASDGGIFAFGGASVLGSECGLHLNRPIVGIVDIGGGTGYWSVASDGGVFGSGP